MNPGRTELLLGPDIQAARQCRPTKIMVPMHAQSAGRLSIKPAMKPARPFAKSARNISNLKSQISNLWLRNAAGLLVLCLCWPPASLAETILITGAAVHTVSGPTLGSAQVLIKDGKIAAVESAIKVKADRVVKLNGYHLYPGLIAASTSLGLTEINAVRASQDTAEVGDYTPDVQAWIAVNPDSELLPVARANGITHALALPMGGIVTGQSGLIALEGWTTEQLTVKQPVALHLFWPGMALDTTPREQFKDKSKWKSLEDQAKERRKKLKQIDDFFEEARAYAKAREAAGKSAAPDAGLQPAWEAMLPLVRGDIPLMIHAQEIRQIKSALTWVNTRSYKMILAGGQDAWKAAELLAKSKIPVIYEGVFQQPARDTEAYDIHFRAPEILRKAGVTVIFGPGAGSSAAANIRNLPYAAAQAVAFGFPADEALKAVTLYPAQVLGVGDRLGSIEIGKEATLFASDGDILDLRANVKRMWIAGREVSLESRHTRLYEKYKLRPTRR